VKSILDFKNGFLCVLTESDISDGLYRVNRAKEWHPIHVAKESEVRTLIGRPVSEVDKEEGIYVDED
jgi:hypothetical protein